MILAEHLHKRFSGVHAVNDVSLEVRPGEIFGLLGPNGAGKSTTIRMITNIIQPDSGTITYNGVPFSDAIRNNIGYLAEERGLYQKAMILETILYFAKLRGVDSATAKQRARQWMERFALAGSEKRKLEELSKGNQQKVQLIISLIHEPEYIILDEPSSGLDPVNQELLRSIISDLQKQGKTILYSTHQMDLAERLCDRIALINKGQVVLSGTVDSVRDAHSGNTVRIEFEGDGAFLKELPPVAEGYVYANSAELTLHDGITINTLFPYIADRIRVSQIARVRPTLNAIFIETVGQANVPQEMLQHRQTLQQAAAEGGV